MVVLQHVIQYSQEWTVYYPRRLQNFLSGVCKKEKRKRSDSVVWQKPLHLQTNPKRNVTTQKRRQKFDYTTIADRHRTVSWGNDSHPTGVVKPVNLDPNPPTHHNSCIIEDTNMQYRYYFTVNWNFVMYEGHSVIFVPDGFLWIDV